MEYPYFETEEPQRWETPHSYTESREPLGQPVTYEWNHGLGEIVQAVIDAGLRLTHLEEPREIEWPFFGWMQPTDCGGFVLPDRPERLPLTYSLEAVKDA